MYNKVSTVFLGGGGGGKGGGSDLRLRFFDFLGGCGDFSEEGVCRQLSLLC